MDLNFLLRGLILGFSIAAPVGPIGVLCIRRTLADGRTTGLVCGLGAATADALYGAVAAFGLTVLSTALVHQQTLLRGTGGAFLIFLGIRTLLARPAQQAAHTSGRGLAGAYTSTFLLTLTNPMTILSFTAIFAGLGLAAGGGAASAGALVAGVFLGSALWWLILSGGTALLRDKLSLLALQWVNRISGILIVFFGLAALASVL